jgi:DNA replication licensing factor MCM3
MKEMNAAVVVPPASLREQQFEERWRLFQDFLRSPLNDIKESGEKDGSLTYEQRLQTFIEQKPSPISPSDVDNRRFLINLNDVRTFNVEAAQGLLQTPLEWIPAMERAVQEVCLPFSGQLSNTTSAYAYAYGKRDEKVRIGFEGAFGELHTSPRGLTSRFLGHLVCMDGIVTSCSLVRPKLVRSVHYSEHVNGFMAKEYSDATQVAPTNIRALGNNTYPTEDEHQRKLLSEFGLSTFRDSQTVTVQEMPERMPPGQLPRAIDVLLTDDLVDAVKPGDRVRVVGVYKALAGVFNGVAPGTFRALLIANHLKQLRHGNYSAGNAEMLTAKETALIRTLSRRKDIFSLLSRSLAPSIFGHDKIKQAVLLMLLSGAERNFATSGTHLRGDINILLIGDPSTAKSQMLRFVLGIASNLTQDMPN